MTEYRVSWQRKDGKVKHKRYVHLTYARRFLTILGPEPWKAWKRDADDFDCCNGHECGCGGLTYRQRSEEKRKEIPALEWIRLETRQVGNWNEAEKIYERLD